MRGVVAGAAWRGVAASIAWIVATSALASVPDVGLPRHDNPHQRAWTTNDGKVLEENDARRSTDGFGVWLVVTRDQAFADTWSGPAADLSMLVDAESVSRGGRLFAVPLFVGAVPDADGNLHVECDARMTRPDGSVSVDQRGESCADGKADGHSDALRISRVFMGFVSEASDAPGVWDARFVVRDVIGGRSVSVHRSFTVLP